MPYPITIIRAVVEQHIEDGLSQSDIARLLGVSQGALWKAYKRWNLPVGYNYRWLRAFTPQQSSVLIGTLLGDGCLAGKRLAHHQACLAFCHGLPQEDYLVWKAKQFGRLFTHLEPNYYLKSDGNWAISISSRCHPLLTALYDQTYIRPDAECIPRRINKKCITADLLMQVDDLALAVWWADDGSMEVFHGDNGRRDAALLVVGAVADPEYALVGDWLCSQGYAVTMKTPKTGSNCRTFRFSADDTDRLMRRLSPHLATMPPSIHGKMGMYSKRLAA